MKRNKRTLNTLLALTLGSFFLSSCGPPATSKSPPTPTPSPYVSPTPVVTPTPFITPTPGPEVTPTPSLAPLKVVELPNGNLVSDSFKLDFGPGSKGVKLEFGPGTKGAKSEFGPGTKGPKNIEFNINLPGVLTNPNLQPFVIAQLAVGGGAFLSQLKVEFIRDNQLYATASILPRRESLDVDAKFHPGTYSIQVVAQTIKGPLTMSYSKLEILPEYKASLKVEIFSDPAKTTKPEDLDVEILSQNRKEKVVLSEDLPSPSPTGNDNLTPVSSPSPSESPGASASPTASPSVSPTASPSPSPTPSPTPTASAKS